MTVVPGAPAPLPPAPVTADVLTPYALRCEHRTTPLGIDEPAPWLSWALASARRGDALAEHRVLVAETAEGLERDGELLWDSGPRHDRATVGVTYAGPPLRPRTRYHWRVCTTAADGATASADSWFETGLPSESWQAAWIGRDPAAQDPVDPPEEGDRPLPSHGLAPCPLLRRSFAVAERPARARVYATARGLYELRLNGERVGDAELAPGWTDYDRRVAYRAYDVTAALREGENTLAATIADGWYSGFVGFDPRRAGAHYGRHPQLLAELHLDFADGRHEVVATDGRWRTAQGPVRYADLLMGECHDARLQPAGWDEPGFADDDWLPAHVFDTGHAHLEAAVDEPVRAFEQLAPRTITRAGERAHVVDFGQNFSGRVRLVLRDLEPGARVVLRHAEALDDGRLYVDNLRTAAATDVFISAGAVEEVFEPRFTFHGFRYVEVTGVEELAPGDIAGVVLHSDTPWVGAFACSDRELERLHRCIAWGQRSNFLSVPTDCPQRDERLGWLADAQVFLPTAALNADVAAFFAKWMRDVLDAQSPDGAFSNVAPRIAGVADDGAPGWGDAGVLVPWHLYRVHGDRRILEATVDAMSAWVDFIHRHNPDLVWRRRVGPHFGDWLAPGQRTPRDVLATAYFARSAQLTADAALVVGRDDLAERHGALAERIRAAFCERFVAADARIEGDTQTGYLLALAFDLLPAALVRPAVERLVASIHASGGRLATGFLGVALLAPVLDAHGHADLAHELLDRTDVPSWRHQVRHGATTIWERWDGYTPEDGFRAPAMNSLNHYALGSIGEWLYRGVAGLDQTPGSVAYRELLVRPRPGRLEWASAVHESVRGRIEVGWARRGTRLELEVAVPPGAIATVHVPTADPDGVREGGEPAAASAGVEVLASGDGELICRVQSGRYRFTAPVEPPREQTAREASAALAET